MMNAIVSLSATTQAKLIRARRISVREMIDAYLGQIAAVNPSLHAAAEIFGSRARAEARAADESRAVGVLYGVPFSVKDSIEVAGTVCTAGTMGRRDAAVSPKDATLVARLRTAGAIPIAKTNLPDFLFAFESDNLLFGRTNNPYDSTRTSGGSSGGEAALIAACGSPMGLGSDCAGSVRVPAAFCGIAAIKPTSGRLPRTGHFPPAGGWKESLWQIGPMARSVADLRVMMRVLAGQDSADGAGKFTEEASGRRVAFYDAVVCPVYTQPALPHDASVFDANFRGFSHTMAYNLAGLPAVVVRCGESAEGLPIGVQVVARRWREDVALGIAERIEEVFGGWKAPPALSAANVR